VPPGEQPVKGVQDLMTYSILLVDDSAILRRALRVWLEQNRGWEVAGEAANGLEAIKLAQQLDPDVVILDFAMPIMDGLEAARELKRLRPSIPLVLFTSYKSPTLEAQARAAGCSALLSKAEPQCLVDCIQRLLPAAI
jgi:CheY-like chemotaxis protein